MATLTDRISAVAKTLVTAAGMFVAINSTDIQSHARQLNKEFGQYSQSQIANKIADEIKKTHTPGIHGSL
jgi:hypothetical protein